MLVKYLIRPSGESLQVERRLTAAKEIRFLALFGSLDKMEEK
jgi:hypothetical protein